MPIEHTERERLDIDFHEYCEKHGNELGSYVPLTIAHLYDFIIADRRRCLEEAERPLDGFIQSQRGCVTCVENSKKVNEAIQTITRLKG